MTEVKTDQTPTTEQGVRASLAALATAIKGHILTLAATNLAIGKALAEGEDLYKSIGQDEKWVQWGMGATGRGEDMVKRWVRVYRFSLTLNKNQGEKFASLGSLDAQDRIRRSVPEGEVGAFVAALPKGASDEIVRTRLEQAGHIKPREKGNGGDSADGGKTTTVDVSDKAVESKVKTLTESVANALAAFEESQDPFSLILFGVEISGASEGQRALATAALGKVQSAMSGEDETEQDS